MNSQVALVVKNLPANAGDTRDTGSIPGLGRSPGGGHSSPLQDSCLENPSDRGAWRAAVRGVTKSRTRLKRLSTHVLAAQWLRLGASTVWSLVRELGSHTSCGSAKNKYQEETDLGRGQSLRWGLCAGYRVREVELWGDGDGPEWSPRDTSDRKCPEQASRWGRRPGFWRQRRSRKPGLWAGDASRRGVAPSDRKNAPRRRTWGCCTQNKMTAFPPLAL